MSKKLYAALLPVLVVGAFTAMPAIASANTTAYGTCVAEKGHAKEGPCKVEEKFVAFTEKREAVISKNHSASFVLENEEKTADITCTVLEDVGKFWNVGGVGHSHLIVVFEGCTGTGALKECSINPKENHVIEGVVTDLVLAGGLTVEIKIESGFNVKCLKGGVEEELGNVTGSAVGSQAEGSAVLKFKEAKGLKFLGKPSTITGEDETETFGKKPVFIN